MGSGKKLENKNKWRAGIDHEVVRIFRHWGPVISDTNDGTEENGARIVFDKAYLTANYVDLNNCTEIIK